MNTQTILIHNAHIFTSDTSNLWAEAMITEGNIISWIGSNREAKTIMDAHKFSIVINARGHTVMPGFNDSHFHLAGPSFKQELLDLSNVRTFEELTLSLQKYAECTETGWIEGKFLRRSLLGLPRIGGTGLRESQVSLTRHHLDRIISNRPVIIHGISDNENEKIGWCNTPALKLGKLFTQSKLICEQCVLRDNEKYPNGELKNVGIDIVTSFIPKIGNFNEMCKCGITSVQIMGANISEFYMFKEFEKDGKLPIRLMYALDRRSFIREEKDLTKTLQLNTPMVRIGGLKLYSDGLVEAGSAYRLPINPPAEDYVVPWGKGKEPIIYRGCDCKCPVPTCEKTNYTIEEMTKWALTCEKYGLQLFVHATGDAAVKSVLDAVDQATPKKPSTGRHRIEHVELCEATDFERFGKLGVLASMSPLHAPSPLKSDPGLGWMRKVHPCIFHRAFAWKSIREHGGRVPLSTDFPVVSLDPFKTLFAAIAREPWLPGDPVQSFTLEDAIIGYTTESAYAEFQEHHKGQLKPGMLADFVLLSQDIFLPDTSKETVQNIKTLITVCDGKIVYLSPEFNISTIPSSRISSIPLHVERSISNKFLCRPAKQSEYKFIISDLAKQGLGNPGVYDHQIMPNVDKNGWFVGELDGKIVSSISCVKWNKKFAYIGHYVCDIRHRGNGYGLQTWNHGLNYLQDCETIALDAELSQVENFKKSGFKQFYTSTRFSGSIQFPSITQNIVPLAQFTFDQINSLFTKATGLQRSDFLKTWINQTEAKAFGYMDSNKQLVGFGVIRPSTGSYRIGPLIVNHPSKHKEIAQELICALATHAMPTNEKLAALGFTKSIDVDIPETNQIAVDLLCNQFSFKPLWKCARMYKGKPQWVKPPESLWGVTSWEVGP